MKKLKNKAAKKMVKFDTYFSGCKTKRDCDLVTRSLKVKYLSKQSKVRLCEAETPQ